MSCEIYPFGDSDAPLLFRNLNLHFKTNSYYKGTDPTTADAKLFEKIESEPKVNETPYLSRWYHHMKDIMGDWFEKMEYNLHDTIWDEEEAEDKFSKREKILAEYADWKKKHPGPPPKSSLVLDIKPMDDETDIGEMEMRIREVTEKGLLWGESKIHKVTFGGNKLEIKCIVEEKVSIEQLIHDILQLQDVQSVDIVSFNKI